MGEIRLWWLSFVDIKEMPNRFLGVVIMAGRDMTSAIASAWVAGANPGGYAVGQEIPAGFEHYELALGCQGVLMSLDDLRRKGFDVVMQGDMV